MVMMMMMMVMMIMVMMMMVTESFISIQVKGITFYTTTVHDCYTMLSLCIFDFHLYYVSFCDTLCMTYSISGVDGKALLQALWELINHNCTGVVDTLDQSIVKKNCSTYSHGGINPMRAYLLSKCLL